MSVQKEERGKKKIGENAKRDLLPSQGLSFDSLDGVRLAHTCFSQNLIFIVRRHLNGSIELLSFPVFRRRHGRLQSRLAVVLRRHGKDAEFMHQPSTGVRCIE